MPELRSKIPKRIGVLLSSESLWEVIFCFQEVEKNGYMRLPVALSPEKAEPVDVERRFDILHKLARIEIVDADEMKTGSISALLICAGKNEFNSLCNFENKGEAYGIDIHLRSFIRTVYRKGLPIGAFGYSVPLLVKAVQGITKSGPVVTVGNDPKLQSGIEATGSQAITTRPTEVIIDNTNKLVTCGGQLSSTRLEEVADDCKNMFQAILELIKG